MPVTIDGEAYEAIFAKVAVNVVRRAGAPRSGESTKRGEENELPAILRGWFGPTAGAPGTNRHVTFRPGEGGWALDSVGPREPTLRRPR
jgi:hypothetical protein